MYLIFVRHGESIGNKKNIVQGQTDFVLSTEGLAQSHKVAERFKNNKIDVIYSSDLKRAAQTAKIIRNFHKRAPLIYSRLLRERNFGFLEGKGVDSVNLKSFRNRRPRGGETPINVKKRVKKFLNYLFKKHSAETILVVTHGGVIRMLYGIIKKKTIKECYEKMPSGFLKNTCVFEIEGCVQKRKKVFRIIKENCIFHLRNISSKKKAGSPYCQERR